MPEQFTLFFGAASPFSQHHPSKFTINGVTYCCCEQYMMREKAVLFEDPEMARKILETTDPKEMKQLGRKVKNFVVEVWKSKCKDIVKEANRAKFSQNPKLKEALLATSGTTLVEASPFDRIWGIGLSKSNPKAKQKETWRGQNWLGYILTEIREELLLGDKELSESQKTHK